MKTKTMTSALSAGLPVKLHLAAAALILGLLAMPHIGHAQGIVRGAHEGAYEGNRVAGPWVGWLAARSAPASAARWAPSRACSEFRIAAIGAAIVATAITTATTISTAIDKVRS